ncbi:hypothetical protein WICPIJ_008062 [Wickerhamomyces pijperi]|uniref:Cell division control protein 25 n=1 Tax=Wickerhamomyces pijperi TaxID=599730 RepID=A0A9P8Q128_WICPI|nr:hypothetical protein WICPIJ_008062 [Wickerhamomyces pijperi]
MDEEEKRPAEMGLRAIDTVKVHSEFKTAKPNMINLYVGDIVYVFMKSDSGWWDGAIATDTGIIRGWFPSNHTRPLLDTNPSSEALNKFTLNQGSAPYQGILKNGSNSNFNQLLRSNLDSAFSSKPRKNSSVSFASSENSYQSNTNQGTSVFTDANSTDPVFDKSHNLSIVEPVSPIISIDKVKVVSAQEAESIFSSIGSSNVPIWSPMATTNGSIIYYNSELNIYCKELPYIETPEINDNTKFTIPTNAEDPIPLSVVNLNQAFHERGVQNIRNRPSTVSYSERKDSSRDSIKSRSSLPSNATNTVHPWNTSLYCLPDLFYYDPTDIKTWPALRDAFLYFANLSEDALTKRSGALFFTYFNIMSRLGVLLNLAARLAQHDLQKSGYQNRVQKRLKKMSSAIAQIGVNGNLYLSETGNAAGDSEDQGSKDANNRNFSTSTQETVKANCKQDMESSNTQENNEDKDENKDEHEDLYDEGNINFDFLQQVQVEMINLKRSAISCVKIFIQISSNQLNDQAYLPQVYPRFLSGFFSGGNWRNPFLPEPTDPFAGKEVCKSLHEKRLSKVILCKETLEMLEFKRDELKAILEDVLTELRENRYSQQRNVVILSKIHKSLPISTKFIDILEGLDFSIFSSAKRNHSKGDILLEDEFDPSKLIYLVLTEFFESKQEARDLCITIIMEAQNLTLSDQTVFKSIKTDTPPSFDKFANVEPEKSARQLEAQLNKMDVESSNGLSVNNESEMEYLILRALDLLDICITLVQQLISEKDSLLNYATRVMNDDFTNFDLIPNSHREDSTVTNDEYALPASTTNRHGAVKEVPWYLESEEYNLIFTNNDTVKGGTREALIQRLTHHDLLDASFNLTFLITFRSMVTTTTLMDLLIKRFNIEPPENLSYEEYTDWVEKKSYPIKLRVVNIMKSLLLKYWTPSYNEPQLPKVLGEFIETLIEQKFPGSEQLAREFNKKVIQQESNVPEPAPSANDSSDVKVFSSKIKKMKLLEVDFNEFANQLTIKESSLYSRITQMECLDKSWNNKYGSLGGFKNLQAFISNSNDLTNFVSTQIVMYNDVKKRVSIIRYFVNVAEKCRQLKNFSSMTAIISALYSSPIHRLKKTWDAVPQSILNLMNKLNDLMNSSRNFSEYREHLRFISDKPCVPFLGVFLSDLTFTTNGNPDHLHGDSKLVNFAKRSKTVDILREMSRYQNLKYNIKKNDEIQDFITFRLSNLLMIDEQYNRSLTIEPRVRVSQQLQSINGLTMQSTNNGSISSSATVKGRSGRYFG